MQKTFTLAGGDNRQIFLGSLLAENGGNVRAFALDNAVLAPGIIKYTSIEKAVSGADCIILPLPCADENGRLNTPNTEKTILIEDIFAPLSKGQIVAGGRVPHKTFELAGRMGVLLFDYLEREELAVANAVITAEGAIQTAMELTPHMLHSSRCLVVGYGRIGKILAHFLRGIGADVTVSARKKSDIAWIDAYGYKSADTLLIGDMLGGFDVIFNTVPAPVLTAQRLVNANRSCLIIDLSSKPGGTDFEAAKELGIKTIWALSLPGRVAPVSSGRIIYDTICNILSEQE